MSQFPKFLKNFGKYPKGGPLDFFFSFIFNTLFYSVIPNETIRMPFRSEEAEDEGNVEVVVMMLFVDGGHCR